MHSKTIFPTEQRSAKALWLTKGQKALDAAEKQIKEEQAKYKKSKNQFLMEVTLANKKYLELEEAYNVLHFEFEQYKKIINDTNTIESISPNNASDNKN